MTSQSTEGIDRTEPTTPDPDDPRKPDAPTDLEKRTWRYVARKVWREFGDDQCTDLAAALTYYAVLAIFPAAIALSAILGLVGQSETSVQTVLDVLEPLVSEDTLGTIEPTLLELASSQTAGLALVIGALGALWSASGYVGAFGRAMNRIYEIGEGRPFWKLRPIMLLITLVAIFLVALGAADAGPQWPGGPVDRRPDRRGRPGRAGVELRQVAGDGGLGDADRRPALLRHPQRAAAQVPLDLHRRRRRDPDLDRRRPRLCLLRRQLRLYNKTYGSLAGVVVGLVFLWLTNVALLLGAEIDSELERGRQLQAGIAAETELQLPARDTRNIEKAAEKEADDAARGRSIRQHADQHSSSE